MLIPPTLRPSHTAVDGFEEVQTYNYLACKNGKCRNEESSQKKTSEPKNVLKKYIFDVLLWHCNQPALRVIYGVQIKYGEWISLFYHRSTTDELFHNHLCKKMFWNEAWELEK